MTCARTALDVAAALVEIGVAPGDTVALMASNRMEHVLADIAAVHAGATPMSIYATLSPDQVTYVAAHSEPSVVVVEGADQLARVTVRAALRVPSLSPAPPNLTWNVVSS